MANHNGVSFVLESLNQLLEQDADLLSRGVEDQLRLLRSDLRRIFSFLRQNEGATENTRVQEVLNSATNVVYKAEIIIHLLAVNVANHRIRGGLGKIFHFCGHTMMLDRASSNLKRILKQIQVTVSQELSSKDEDADQIKEAGGRSSLNKVGRGNMKEVKAEVLDFGEEMESLLSKLINVDQTSREVISIVGKSGSGKTTLAKQIYNDDAVKNHFVVRVWFNVSRKFRVEELLQKIQELSLPIMNETNHIVKDSKPTDEMLKCLLGKRFLIVLDDLREEDVWDKIESVFPDEANGSRILLTTRVCMPRGGTSHDARVLNAEESWRLLSKRVFSGEAQKNLEAIGRDIAAQCEGLSLSITLLGSILARKEQTNAAWSELRETLRLSSMEGDGGKSINFTLLNYVYKSLPDHLGSCFLYFGMFPCGIEIPARQLIQLWIAEGFIETKGTLAMENVGEEYLEDLICLSLVQVAMRRTDGGVKSCKIHDSFQEYCISEGINRKFFQVGATTNSASVESTGRLAIHVDSVQDASISRLRSTYSDVHSFQLSVQDPVANLAGQQWNLLRDGFRFLRVLNLGFVSVHRIPEEVGKLFHLRYLRIRSPRSKHVPRSICNLLNLQTLDVRESSVSSIPKGIWKMQQLRHLCLGYLPSLPEPDGISIKALGSLQTLSSIRPNRVAKQLMVRAKFPNLRKLKLSSQSKQETLEFLKSLDHLIHLETLKIVSEANLADTNIDGLLPDPNAFPLTLTKITLLDTHLIARALNKLEMLPNLQILKLHRNSVVGEEMACNAAGGFPQLQVLQLKELGIKKWTVERNAMRNLRHLVISKCISLTVIPDHTNWAKMREVELFLPTDDLRESVQQFILKRGCKVHIQPSTAIHTTGDNTVTCNSPP